MDLYVLSLTFNLLGQFSSIALLFPDTSQVFMYGNGLKLLTGGPVQFIKANDDMWSLVSKLLLEETISFIELNDRSHSAEEMAKVLTAFISGLMLSFNEEGKSLYSRKPRTLACSSTLKIFDKCRMLVSPY